MTHFALLWKARTIEKHRQKYEDEKINSILKSNADIPEKTLFQRWRHYSHDVQKRLSRTFSKWYPEGTTMSNFLVNFRAEMRFPHILLRSLFGFVGGLVLTYLCFVFLVFQLSLSLVHATILSSIFGVLITLGLTFSNRMRSLVFLLIPQLFSRAGRYTLTCYALVLILTGPATNTLKNSEVLSESMACSQELIKTDVREINESLEKPLNSIKDSIKRMVEAFKLITPKLRLAILKVNRLILSVASLIQSSFSWLISKAQSCNKQLGTPHDRCITILKKIVDGCPESYATEHWYHASNSVAKAACGVLNHYDRFCVAADFAEETFFATIKRKLKILTSRLSKALFIKLHTHHSYTFVGNTSSASQVAAGIVTEIRNRADPILTWLSWSSCVTSLFLLLIIFRAKYYQNMYETRSRFDNRYITKEFREFDLKRQREGRETVLPLSKRERAKYVTTTSFRLVASEKTYLNRSAVFMTITTFKLLIHIVADYSLYWVLMTIRYHGTLQTFTEPGKQSTGVYVTGKGFVSRFLQSILDTLSIPLTSSTLSSNACLPNPHPPDFKRYSQIGILIVLQWFFALFEPYGLRLRHLIMGHYKPERAQARAVWLYNHILRTRGSFMKFARRKLHREYKYSSESKLTSLQWLRSIITFQWLRYLLGIRLEEERCLLCSVVEDFHDANLIKCEVENCPGTYCSSCFSDIGQMCTICMSPKDYGDLSDVSLEKGSSDEDDDGDDDGINFDPSNETEENINLHGSSMNKDNSSDANFYDSDNESEYTSDSKDIEYEIPLLLRQHYNTTGKTHSEDKRKVLLDTVKMAYVKEHNLFLLNFHVNYMELLNPNDIDTKNNNYKQNRFTIFGFYRIEIHKMSILITNKRNASNLAKLFRKKIMRMRKKKTKRNLCVFVKCNNNKGGKRNPVKREDHVKENNNSGAETQNNANQNRINEQNNNPKGDKIKKKTNKDRKNEVEVINKISNPRVEKFHEKCSKYWKNISQALSCTQVPDKTNDVPAIEEKKHKRKKKHKKSKEHPKKQHKRDNNEDTRQYRISTYLADQDWMKNKINKFKYEGSPEVQTENEIEVNHIKIPRLNLRFSSDSLNKEENEIFVCVKDSEKDIDFGKKKDLTIGALDRFFKKISLTSMILNSSSRMSESFEKQEQNVTRCNPDFSMTRGMKYFCSLGNDFEQKETHDSSMVDGDLLKQSESKIINAFAELDNPVSVNRAKCKDSRLSIKKDLKKSPEDFTNNLSNKKRVPSECCLGFNFKAPLDMLKNVCNSLFTASDSCVQIKGKESRIEKGTSDKGVEVFPLMTSCGCQINKKIRRENTSTQIGQSCQKLKRLKSVKVCNIQVNAVHPTCTCATQYHLTRRDVGTWINQGPCRERGCLETRSSDDSEFSLDSESEISIAKSDGTKTDTTICSLATIDYHNERRTEVREKRKKVKVKVVTKSNQSTLTDRTRVCDVSTVTHDWWSPIVEKKDRKKEDACEKVKVRTVKTKEKRLMKTRGIAADRRIVTFRSRAQIIPSDSLMKIEDILSPSRYLLESQKYYNELFSSKFYAPHIFPVSNISRHQRLEPRSPAGSRHQCRRGRITKRFEECCTPRKQPILKRRCR